MIKVVTLLLLVAVPSGMATAQSDGHPDGIIVHQTDAASYFRTQSQQSLYWNEREASGSFVCVEECLETWVPLQAKAEAKGQGAWSTVRRPDGTVQWAYESNPLYTYVKDTFPGARLGDGLARGQWKLLSEMRQVPAGMKIEPTYLGYVLADHQGRTLYSRNEGSSAPVDDEHWAPLKAPWLAGDQGDWSIQTIAGGLRQWVYQGRPLFTYDKDNDPEDIQGHNLNDAWSAVILETAPGMPSWMTIQSVDLGLAYANQDGLTIYAPVDIASIERAQTCPEDCMQENWRSILAKEGEESIGNWLIIENDKGQMQWSYKGQLLYTHTRDQKPGDMKGNGIAVGYRIGDGWRIIPVDSGLRRERS